MRVLIVDDSTLMQDRLAAIIGEEIDVEIVGQAFNTVDGANMISKLKPDIVISDIRMPGGGGIELLEFIKKNYPQIKVIIITNYAYPQYKEKVQEIGAEYFLSKSEDLEQLVPILKQELKLLDEN